MQYYHLNTRVKRKPSTLRVLALVNAVLLVGLLSILVLPFIK